MTFIISAGIAFVLASIFVPIFFAIQRLFGIYTVVNEQRSKVFVLFGRVIGVIDEPGLHIPLFKFGKKALLVSFFGKIHELDMRLDRCESTDRR